MNRKRLLSYVIGAALGACVIAGLAWYDPLAQTTLGAGSGFVSTRPTAGDIVCISPPCIDPNSLDTSTTCSATKIDLCDLIYWGEVPSIGDGDVPAFEVTDPNTGDGRWSIRFGAYGTSGAINFDFSGLADEGTCIENAAWAVVGALGGDTCIPGWPAAAEVTGINYSCRVSATGEVKVKACCVTAADCADPNSATFSVVVLRQGA